MNITKIKKIIQQLSRYRTGVKIRYVGAVMLMMVSFVGTLYISNDPVSAAPATKAECIASGGTWSSVNSGPGGLNTVDVCTPITEETQSPSWKATSWWYYQAISQCLQDDFPNVVTIDDVTAGRIFNGKDGYASGWYMRGTLDGIGDDGKINCGENESEIYTKALSFWGIKSLDLLCGAQIITRGAGEDCLLTSSKAVGLGKNVNGGDRNVAMRAIQDYLKKNVFAGIEPRLTGAALYIYNYDTFTKDCVAGSSGPQTAKPDGSNVYEIKDKTGKTVYYVGTQTPDHDSEYSPNPNVTKKCRDIANDINTYSPAYQTWLATHPEGDVVKNTRACLQNPSDPNCKKASSCSIDTIGWIVCPVINFLAGIADGAFIFLADNFLKVDVKAFDTSSPTYTVWNVMRNFANIGLVVAFLVIIFSQLSSVGISNYGIKKMLPRIIVAAILVNASYIICQLAVDISNILGYSVKGILAGIPTGSPIAAGSVSPFADGHGFAGIAGGVIAAGIVGTLLYTLLATLTPVLLVAVVGLVMIMFILVARQAIIILLIILAPLAFLAYLLPNTEQMFTKWRKAFVTMLLLFPIIALVFGVSGVISTILSTVFAGGVKDDTNNWFGQMIAAAALVLPLFIIPSLLKKSLDGIGTVGAKMNGLGGKAEGMASKSGQKAYENSRIGQFKKYREGERNIRRAKIQSGTYDGPGGKFNPRNLASSMNKSFNQSSRSGAFGDRALAQGATIENKEDMELMKSADDRLALTSFEPDKPLTQAQMIQIGTGQHVTHDGTATGRKLADASTFDEHTRRAAIQRAAKIATVGDAHALVDAAGAKDANGKNIMKASERKSLVAALAGSGAVAKAPYLGGKTFGDIEAGDVSSDGAALQGILGGKINAEALASGDANSVKKLVDVAIAAPAGSPESIAARAALTAAYTQLTAPGSRLGEKIVGGSAHDVQIQRITAL